jgi:hypothetical protein
VLASAPESGLWRVVGRSDTLEDRIIVRRVWLRSQQSANWGLSLSFAAYGQSLDAILKPGAMLEADVHRYPGRGEVRVLLDHVVAGEQGDALCQPTTIAGACDQVGRALGDVPWIERWPVEVRAVPTPADGQWLLTDHTGSLPLVGNPGALAPLAAESGGYPVDVMAEWTAAGLIPLTVAVDGRLVDVGPRGSFEQRRWADR